MRMTLVVIATLVGFAVTTSAGFAAPTYGTTMGGPTNAKLDLVHWSDKGYNRPGHGYCFYHPHRDRCR
jgi:hypothetical protein